MKGSFTLDGKDKITYTRRRTLANSSPHILWAFMLGYAKNRAEW